MQDNTQLGSHGAAWIAGCDKPPVGNWLVYGLDLVVFAPKFHE